MEREVLQRYGPWLADQRHLLGCVSLPYFVVVQYDRTEYAVRTCAPSRNLELPVEFPPPKVNDQWHVYESELGARVRLLELYCISTSQPLSPERGSQMPGAAADFDF